MPDDNPVRTRPADAGRSHPDPDQVLPSFGGVGPPLGSTSDGAEVAPLPDGGVPATADLGAPSPPNGRAESGPAEPVGSVGSVESAQAESALVESASVDPVELAKPARPTEPAAPAGSDGAAQPAGAVSSGGAGQPGAVPAGGDGPAGAVQAGADGPPVPLSAAGPPRRGRGRGFGRPREQRPGSFFRELPVLLVIAFVLAVLIKTFLVQAFFIPSGSMEQTLHGCSGCSGDRVLVSKVVYRFRDPHPGDIVVFRGGESWAPEATYAAPSNIVERALRAVGSAIGVAPPGEKDFVKRVIAVGGQTVQCCDAQGRVTVDGRPLTEPYVYISEPDGYRPTPFGPVTVPAGRLWVMGDHRDESADSRAHLADADQGTIAVSDVIGKAFVIVWPVTRWGTLGTPATFGGGGSSLALPMFGTAAVVVLLLAGWFFGYRRRQRRGT